MLLFSCRAAKEELNKLAEELNQINLSGLSGKKGDTSEENKGSMDNLFEFLTEVHRQSQNLESVDTCVKSSEDVIQQIGDQMDALVCNLEDEVRAKYNFILLASLTFTFIRLL